MRKPKQSIIKLSNTKQTAKISALSSRNVSKYEFLTSENILLEKELLENASTIKTFNYSQLGSE